MVPTLSIFSMPANTWWQANELRNSDNPHIYYARNYFTHGSVYLQKGHWLGGAQWIVEIDGAEVATFALRFLAEAVAFMSAQVDTGGDRDRDAMAMQSTQSDYEEDWDYEEDG